VKVRVVVLGSTVAIAGVLAGVVGLASARDRGAMRGWLAIGGDRVSITPRFSADSVRSVVAAAEASGALFSGSGKAANGRRCVEAKGPSVTSGDISAGSWSFYPHSWAPGGGKLWWRTARPVPGDPDSSTLTVRAILLDRPLPTGAERNSVSTRIKLRPVTRHGDTLLFTLTEWKAATAFPSGVRVPTPGRWMFIATMGDNWGCFLFRL
jgi:hypothetical protein